jgi:thiol-disulfide isomerase/thioredoxin
MVSKIKKILSNKSVLLVLVLITIMSLIIYFESTKPQIDTTPINSDIEIEKLNGLGSSASGNSVDSSISSKKVLTKTDIQRIKLKSEKYERAKELVDPEGYINIDNITLSENIGKKVILIDFWTYSCINCQRTLPYLTAWHEKYESDGFVIIGVHTPEFEFEKDYDNVVKATEKWNVKYPVVQDNDRQTWRAYKNRYWPRKYLIDIDGFIVFDHIGEGAYAKTEEKIQELLKERNEVLNVQNDIDSEIVSYKPKKSLSFGTTSEVYFGYAFARDQLGNEEGWHPQEVIKYSYPLNKKKNLFYLDGSWRNNADDMELVDEKGSIYLDYYAKDVNIVAGANLPTKMEVYLDGKKIKDITIQDFDLYELVSDEEAENHILELKTEKGIMAYTFTFG